MSFLYKFLVILGLISICNVQALDFNERSASQKDSKNLISCPAEEFSAFIEKFSNDIRIQKTFIKYPLKKERLNIDAEPEPEKITENLARHQIKFPVLPLREERIKNLLKIRINHIEFSSAQATLFKEDTGYQVTYFFVKTECWILTRIEDFSL